MSHSATEAPDNELLGAQTALPFPGLERATQVLRAQLRIIRDRATVDGAIRVLDWDTLTIDGPTEQVDPDGRSWFTYTAAVSTRPIRPLDPPPPPAPDRADTA